MLQKTSSHNTIVCRQSLGVDLNQKPLLVNSTPLTPGTCRIVDHHSGNVAVNISNIDKEVIYNQINPCVDSSCILYVDHVSEVSKLDHLPPFKNGSLYAPSYVLVQHNNEKQPLSNDYIQTIQNDSFTLKFPSLDGKVHTPREYRISNLSKFVKGFVVTPADGLLPILPMSHDTTTNISHSVDLLQKDDLQLQSESDGPDHLLLYNSQWMKMHSIIVEHTIPDSPYHPLRMPPTTGRTFSTEPSPLPFEEPGVEETPPLATPSRSHPSSLSKSFQIWSVVFVGAILTAIGVVYRSLALSKPAITHEKTAAHLPTPPHIKVNDGSHSLCLERGGVSPTTPILFRDPSFGAASSTLGAPSQPKKKVTALPGGGRFLETGRSVGAGAEVTNRSLGRMEDEYTPMIAGDRNSF